MSDISVQRLDLGMVTLRGSFADAAFAKAVKAAAGAALPGVRSIVAGRDASVAWMSPDELLILGEPDAAPGIARSLSEALAGQHHLAVDVSDARTAFEIAGRGVREVLAKGSPADLSPAAFGPGDFRRSRIGQLAAAFWMPREDCFRVICFRSLGDHLDLWLRHAARPGSLPCVF
jgi:sarcosine oxidase subunit gamma